MNQLNNDQNEMINKAAADWGCTRAAAYRKLYPKWQRDLIKAMGDAPDFKAENAQKRAKTKSTLGGKGPSMKPLYKTTYVLWTEHRPEFTFLQGDDYGSVLSSTLVYDPASDPDMDAEGLEWFNAADDSDRFPATQD